MVRYLYTESELYWEKNEAVEEEKGKQSVIQ